jgi:hypothetical protein
VAKHIGSRPGDGTSSGTAVPTPIAQTQYTTPGRSSGGKHIDSRPVDVDACGFEIPPVLAPVQPPIISQEATSSLSTGQFVAQTDGLPVVYSVNFKSGYVILRSRDIPELGNLYFTEVRVLGTSLSGLEISNSAITQADSILSALGKLQGQMNAVAGDNAGYDYGTANAIIVKDNANADMTGLISATTPIVKTFAYDTNIQRGAASAGDDAPITAVAIGLSTAQFVKTTGTITKSTSNSVSLVAPLERNYQNTV